MNEKTLSIIKPDAMKKNKIGEIISRFENAGLTVAAAKMSRLSGEQAGDFYAIHKDRPFYQSLIAFMTSGAVMILVLQGDDAIKKNRDLMGATHPADAAPGTIRADFADSVEANAVHGSDSLQNANDEIAFFFADSFADSGADSSSDSGADSFADSVADSGDN